MKKIKNIFIIVIAYFAFMYLESWYTTKSLQNQDFNLSDILNIETKNELKPDKKTKGKNPHVQNHLNQGDTVPFNKSLYKKFNDIEIFLINPNTVKFPKNTCTALSCSELINNINSAKNSIDFAIYGIEGQNDIIEALSLAKQRGVKIRGVADSRQDESFVYNDTKKLIQLFDIKTDLHTPYMHNKFFIFDESIVFTGTMNISNTGSGGYNANTVVLIKNKDAAAIYKAEFEQMYNGRFQNEKEDFNKKINLQNGNLHILFSPASKPYTARILPILQHAEKEIFISIFYLTHKGIVQELINAKERGVDVRIIFDAVGASNNRQIVQNLREKGVLLKVENWGGKNHEKNMMVDGKIFITGSANFSNSGMGRNDENILIFESPEIASFYRGYFLKLYNSLDKKYLTKIPMAESIESINSCNDGVDNDFDGKIDKEDFGCKGL